MGVPSLIPSLGLREADLTPLALGGLGDGYNSYAHAMCVWGDDLYVGVSRCVFQALALHAHSSNWSTVEHWPVAAPKTGLDGLYTELDRRGQIWAYNFREKKWRQIFLSPAHRGESGELIPREFGYRCAVLHRWCTGLSDESLYITATATGRSDGARILRIDQSGSIETFGSPGLAGLPITSVRSLVSFKGALYAAPSGSRGSRSNSCDFPFVFRCESADGLTWKPVCLEGFGDKANVTIFTLYAGADYLYAGTMNHEGCQIWRTTGESNGDLCVWECLVRNGAGRGSLNQTVACMEEFNGALYVGTGIQNGGYDIANKIGPAAGEVFRILRSGKVEAVVGSGRLNKGLTRQSSLSGLGPGFGNPLNGYIWSMCSHLGWLYAGTCNIGVMLEYVRLGSVGVKARRLLGRVGIHNIVENQAGAELWRTRDGENWVPVVTGGLSNKYNLGIRNLISHDLGLIVGTANPFGPTIFSRRSLEGDWVEAENRRGGFEVYCGNRSA